LKYERTPSFVSDWRGLTDDERTLFRSCVLQDFVPACDRVAAEPAARFPSSLRVKDVERVPGIFEMTWSFSGPDGRATFEWVTIDGERALRWRRIGGHGIFRTP
jgi:hypothetical protein